MVTLKHNKKILVVTESLKKNTMYLLLAYHPVNDLELRQQCTQLCTVVDLIFGKALDEGVVGNVELGEVRAGAEGSELCCRVEFVVGKVCAHEARVAHGNVLGELGQHVVGELQGEQLRELRQLVNGAQGQRRCCRLEDRQRGQVRELLE